ncbi:hypothetical protein L5F64_01145 [Aliarcobacter butzleri]|nr:hypothetical protein [Aliarcobacter butzleri]
MTINRLFPNLSTEGYYNFLNQTIVLNKLEKKELANIDKLPKYEKIRNFLSLVVHEYTHYIDSFSTLWGIEFLHNLYNSYFIDNFEEVPENIYFKKLLSELKKLDTHKFYSEFKSDKEIQNTIPWKYNYVFSVIDDNPLIKINFRNKNDDKIVCTVPISLLSILESSAMSQEILLISHMTTILLKEEERDKKLEAYKNYLLLHHLYHRELTEYSVCVHIVSNSLLIENIIVAYHITSILTRFVLNFPKKYFLNINIDDFNNFYFKINEYNRPIIYKALKDNNDKAILFLLIALELTPSDIQSYTDENIKKGIEIAILRLGVKIDKTFLNEVEIEFTSKLEFFKTCGYERINIMTQYGFENFKTLGVFGSAIYDFSKIKLPRVILGDDTEIPIFKNCFNDISPIKHAEHVYNGEKSLNYLYKMYLESKQI